MKTLITGATGFVGSAVLRALLMRGHDVRALVREGSDQKNLAGLDVTPVTGDLRNRDSLERALEGCENLFHVAADYRLWAPRPQDIVESNVEGTRNIMQAALKKGVRRIVYTSSVATLGLHADGRAADEDTPVSFEQMIGAYKQSKFLAEEEVRRMVHEKGLPAVIVNPAAPIGPRDIKPTPTGRMIVEAASGRMPAFVDTGLNVVHVDDVAEGHMLAFLHGRVGQRYVLGAENMSLRQILNSVAQLTGRRPPLVELPHTLLMPLAYVAEAFARFTGGKEPMITLDGLRLSKKRMFFSIEKARRELGYEPRPAIEALRDAIAWFRAEGYCR